MCVFFFLGGGVDFFSSSMYPQSNQNIRSQTLFTMHARKRTRTRTRDYGFTQRLCACLSSTGPFQSSVAHTCSHAYHRHAWTRSRWWYAHPSSAQRKHKQRVAAWASVGQRGPAWAGQYGAALVIMGQHSTVEVVVCSSAVCIKEAHTRVVHYTYQDQRPKQFIFTAVLQWFPSDQFYISSFQHTPLKLPRERGSMYPGLQRRVTSQEAGDGSSITAANRRTLAITRMCVISGRC